MSYLFCSDCPCIDAKKDDTCCSWKSDDHFCNYKWGPISNLLCFRELSFFTVRGGRLIVRRNSFLDTSLKNFCAFAATFLIYNHVIMFFLTLIHLHFNLITAPSGSKVFIYNHVFLNPDPLTLWFNYCPLRVKGGGAKLFTLGKGGTRKEWWPAITDGPPSGNKW